MPRLTEVDKLSTSDSSGGRIKSSAKRKYHVTNCFTVGSTRSKSRRVEDAVSGLLSVSEAVRENGTTISQEGTNEFPNKKETEEVTQEFAYLPDDFDITEEDRFVLDGDKKLLSGNRLINIKVLDNAMRKNFCCKQCIDKAVKNYLHLFFEYADNQIKDMKQRARNIELANKKVRFYKKETKLVSKLYQKFNGHLGKQKQKQTRTEMIAVPVSLKSSRTVGLATELQFQC